MENSKIFNVALVGCGTISDNHLTALTNTPGVKVVALCDKISDKANSKKEKYALDCDVYTDYYEMINTVALDAVHIATPHFLHAPMTIAALKKNINVFLEKPMCISIEEINQLIEEEKRSQAKVCVCFQNRFIAAVEMAKKLIEEDGGIVSAYGSVFWERNEKYYTDSDWRGFYATEGGGVMINQAIHTIDLLCQLLGTPKKLWATKANHHLKDIIEVEDTCEGVIEFDSGLRGNFYATTSFHGWDATSVYIVTNKRKIEIRHPDIFVDGVKLNIESKNDVIGKACYGSGHQILISKFYNALSCDDEMPVTLQSAQYAIRILLAAYKSNDNETQI